MGNEDFQKQFDFIVEQQARLVVKQDRADERLTRLENIVANAYVDMRDRVNAVADAQLKTEATVGTLAETQQNLAKAQLATEEKLNVLITVIERHISSQSNGNKQ
jgi:hypothetical protein